MKAIDQPALVVDEVIAEVRRHKRAIMADHGDDVDSLLRSLQLRQKGNPRLVPGPRLTPEDKTGSSTNDAS